MSNETSAVTHTPGPWMYVTQADWPFKQAVHITAKGFGVVATVNIDQGMPHLVGQQRANLRLIASAPEVLQALQEITADYADRFDLESPSTNPGIKYCIKEARAAIAKATGASS